MSRALVRTVSRSLASCELLHLPRQTFDIGLARKQHTAYVTALREAGALVTLLPEEPGLPDSTFVEDTLVVLDEVAVLCRAGAESREPEAAKMESAATQVRLCQRIVAPGTLEGGDVLRIGRTLYIGLSTRTNRQGIEQFHKIVSPLGYSIKTVPIHGCLHLKTAVTSPGDGLVIVNPAWIDATAFSGQHVLEVAEGEPWGANTLPVNETLLAAASSPRTLELLESHGLKVRRVGISELQKAEAGVTCLSVCFS